MISSRSTFLQFLLLCFFGIGFLIIVSFSRYQPNHLVGLVQNHPDLKTKALQVLENKCNACHAKKKEVVFTLENMKSEAIKIKTQVFIKKRMPKGKVKLTDAEREILNRWLGSLNLKTAL